MAFESEAFESGEGYESEAWNEWAEAAKKKAPKTASGKGLTPAPPTSKNYVTFTDLRSAMDKVGGQIKTNSDAIAAVHGKLAASLKKEAEERKKDIAAAQRDTNSKTQMLAILPLLLGSPSYTIAPGAIDGTLPTSAVTLNPPPTSTLNALVPFLLIGGMGSSPAGTPDTGGMDNTMFLALALALQNR